MAFHLDVSRSGEILGRKGFDAPVVRIGRDRSNDFPIDHPTLSRQHAIIEQAGAAFTIRDMGSQNGTLVNGKPVAKGPHALNEGDEIQVGEFTLTFRGGAPAAADVPMIQDKAAYAVFGQTLQVRAAGDHDLRERSATVHAHLIEAGTPRIYALDRDVLLLGAGSGCHVRIGGWFAPRIAAAIIRGHGGWSIVRLGRRSVSVRGEVVLDRTWLADGDKLTVAGKSFTFKTGLPQADAPKT